MISFTEFCFRVVLVIVVVVPVIVAFSVALWYSGDLS